METRSEVERAAQALVQDASPGATVDHAAEAAEARRLADRYRLEFVDMDEFRIDPELFRSIPADLMLRYGFVPCRRDGTALGGFGVVGVPEVAHGELAAVTGHPGIRRVAVAPPIDGIVVRHTRLPPFDGAP